MLNMLLTAILRQYFGLLTWVVSGCKNNVRRAQETREKHIRSTLERHKDIKRTYIVFKQGIRTTEDDRKNNVCHIYKKQVTST